MAKKNKKQKTITQDMGEYLDYKMSKVSTFEESIAVLNRTLNHIDEHATA